MKRWRLTEERDIDFLRKDEAGVTGDPSRSQIVWLSVAAFERCGIAVEGARVGGGGKASSIAIVAWLPSSLGSQSEPQEVAAVLSRGGPVCWQKTGVQTRHRNEVANRLRVSAQRVLMLRCLRRSGISVDRNWRSARPGFLRRERTLSSQSWLNNRWRASGLGHALFVRGRMGRHCRSACLHRSSRS